MITAEEPFAKRESPLQEARRLAIPAEVGEAEAEVEIQPRDMGVAGSHHPLRDSQGAPQDGDRLFGLSHVPIGAPEIQQNPIARPPGIDPLGDFLRPLQLLNPLPVAPLDRQDRGLGVQQGHLGARVSSRARQSRLGLTGHPPRLSVARLAQADVVDQLTPAVDLERGVPPSCAAQTAS